MQANTAYVAAPIAVSGDQRRRAIIATVIGNGLEWFDFTVYSFFAVIIAKQFFPTGSELTSLLLAVATFGVGFFMRPVGGIVLGIYADRVGRKAALSMTILLMAAGTTLIGLAPTYAQVRILGPCIIVVARLLQGFSAGGEMGSATAFLTEYAPAKERAYYSSWIQASIGLAVLLGAAVGTFVTSSLDAQSLASWGWRLPFLLGIVIGPVGYYIRHHLDETPAFQDSAQKTDSPLKEVFRQFLRETAASFSMVILWTVCTYVLLFQLVFGVLIAIYTGPILAAFSELFPAKVLSTGLSVAYNFAVTIFGGFASFFITWLISATGNTMAPAFYVMIAAAISFIGTRFVRDPQYLQQR